MTMIIAVLIFTAIVLVFNHYTWKAKPWPSQALSLPQYQGHRGFWKNGAQENTMASFKAAKDRGLLMVEMDARLSKDQEVVIYHDKDLRRLAHSDKSVEELNATELAQLSQVCKLEEVLQSSDIPNYLNIELKTDRAFDDRLEKKVATLIRQNHAEKRVLFSSFNPLALRRLRKLLPEVPCALLATKEKDPANKIYLRHLWLAPYANVHLLHLDHKFVSAGELKSWKKRKIPVAFWTVNEPFQAEKLLAEGAVSIITDVLGGK